MHLLTMFDLPSKTKRERRIYRQFRKRLLELGFTKIQFS
ncbi:MAG: CRISPR-associated endonuclease Cas2, partial [Planctomycetaceae bacterium]|nr:CRISPR-associated endonuclease Cas2 [Planctomycetaceae bacterium]